MPTIVPKNAEHLSQLLTLLIAAAGNQQDRVKTVTTGHLTCFEVDDELAAVVGFSQAADPSAPSLEEGSASQPPTESEAAVSAPKKTAKKA